ncbi:hypothetical protein Ahy_A04g018877 isoform B [Arachis hypogaea]|uniref:Uncharacterized protein n=1 Tax=Arachis hypogaea TaxID=3818 RepID=A0A445DER5_ARAHY|nr:hypothetical protein Ahy_A04g018877 isoform B [Arachis hypogaea]
MEPAREQRPRRRRAPSRAGRRGSFCELASSAPSPPDRVAVVPWCRRGKLPPRLESRTEEEVVDSVTGTMSRHRSCHQRKPLSLTQGTELEEGGSGGDYYLGLELHDELEFIERTAANKQQLQKLSDMVAGSYIEHPSWNNTANGYAHGSRVYLQLQVIRNEALLLLTHLTREAGDIQKIVIFEGAFEKILSIIRGEGNSDGGVVVQGFEFQQIVDIGKTLPLFMELQTLAFPSSSRHSSPPNQRKGSPSSITTHQSPLTTSPLTTRSSSPLITHHAVSSFHRRFSSLRVHIRKTLRSTEGLSSFAHHRQEVQENS